LHRTAKLHEQADQTAISAFQEIRDLQLAYNDMNHAIKNFTRYVPRDVVKDLMASGQLCEIKMNPLRCTMLFVDIAGFTTICERVPAAELSELVRLYFEKMSSIVMTHDGIVDKYIGDCIMAVWGAPFAAANQEVKATLCAALIDRETRVEPLCTAFDQAGEVLAVRVGVATGEVLAGNMGSAERMNYTVIGDAVNLAARLESLNKQFGTRVMVCETTAAALRNLFVLRLLMRIAVVGKDEALNVFEITGLSQTLDPTTTDALRDEDEKAEKTSDTGSNASGSAASTVIGGPVHRRAQNTVAMLHHARNLHAAPLLCTDQSAHIAHQYTEAVLALQAKDFTRCMSAISSLPSDVMQSKAAAVVRELCEAGARNPSDFDGVWRADHK